MSPLKGDMMPRKKGSTTKRSKKTTPRATKRTKTGKRSTSKIDALEVDEDAKKMLKALEKLGKPSKCGEISKEAGFSPQKVAAKMRSLVRKGIVERSEDGLYSLSI